MTSLGHLQFFLKRFSRVRAFTQQNYHRDYAKPKVEIARRMTRKDNGKINNNSWDNFCIPKIWALVPHFICAKT